MLLMWCMVFFMWYNYRCSDKSAKQYVSKKKEPGHRINKRTLPKEPLFDIPGGRVTGVGVMFGMWPWGIWCFSEELIITVLQEEDNTKTKDSSASRVNDS